VNDIDDVTGSGDDDDGEANDHGGKDRGDVGDTGDRNHGDVNDLGEGDHGEVNELAADVPADERHALLTIAHGAVITSGGVSLQRAMTAAIEFVLTQGLGPVVYGVYALAWRIAQLLLRLVSFGTDRSLQRYVPAYDDEPEGQRRVAGLAYATTLVVGLAIGGGLVLSADRLNAATVARPEFTPTMQLFGGLVALAGVVKIHAAVLRAVGSARGEVLFTRVLRPGVRLAGATAAVALGYSVVGVAGALVVGMGVLAVVGAPMAVAATGIRPTIRGARTEARRFFNHAAPIALSSVGKVFQNRVDVLLIGALLTAAAAGVYNVVLVLISIAWIPLLAFNQLLPPVASDLHSRGQTGTLDAIYSSVTRLILTTMLPIVAVQVVFGRELLAVFGPTYVRGYVPLVIYLGGVIVGSAVGATGWLLMMTDHQYARMALDWLLAVLNVFLTYAFVTAFGLAGAALGTAVAIGVQNSLQVVLLRRFEGLWPFDATFLKPVAASVAMAVVMTGIREVVAGFAAVGLGVVVGVATYVGVLALLGVDRRDRLVVRELTGRYRRDLLAYVSPRSEKSG
jgi:O-antigen/teichoic acid export membrane protein